MTGKEDQSHIGGGVMEGNAMQKFFVIGEERKSSGPIMVFFSAADVSHSYPKWVSYAYPLFYLISTGMIVSPTFYSHTLQSHHKKSRLERE